jgi:alkylhydroperoxidase/carboxymuconolactone decarboxylase family protein YurZ
MNTRKGRGQGDILHTIQRVRGYLPDEWAYVAGKDPEFWDIYNALYEKALSDGKALSAKTRELITIGVLSYRELEQGVTNHAKRALRLGATRQELLEAVETVTVSGGSPALRAGLKGLMMLEEEEKKEKNLRRSGTRKDQRRR